MAITRRVLGAAAVLSLILAASVSGLPTEPQQDRREVAKEKAVEVQASAAKSEAEVTPDMATQETKVTKQGDKTKLEKAKQAAPYSSASHKENHQKHTQWAIGLNDGTHHGVAEYGLAAKEFGKAEKKQMQKEAATAANTHSEAAAANDPTSSRVQQLSPVADVLFQSHLKLEKHKKQIEKTVLDTKQAIARMKGGKEAQDVTVASGKVVDQIKRIESQIRNTAVAARARTMKAQLATAEPKVQKTVAAESAHKLSEAEKARDEARRMVEKSAENKREAQRFYAKTQSALEKTDAAKVAEEQRKANAEDDARYELERALRIRQQTAAMNQGSKGKVQAEVAKEKAMEVKASAAKSEAKAALVMASQKMKVMKQEDKAKLELSKQLAEKEAQEVQSLKHQELREETGMLTAKAQVKELKAKDQKHKQAEQMEMLSSKGKLKAAQSALKLAKDEEKTSLRQEKKRHRQAIRAVRDSLRRTVSVKQGVPADQGGITAAQKAAFALKELKVARMEMRERHDQVISATRKMTRSKIKHRFIKLKHESRKQAHEDSLRRAKKKAKKRAQKTLEKGERRAGREERKELRQAKRKIDKKYEETRTAAKKKLKKEFKKAAKTTSPEFSTSKVKVKVKAQGKSKMEKRANAKAEAKINQEWSKMFQAKREITQDVGPQVNDLAF